MPKQQATASELEPGQYVMLEGASDWGLGQIQSVTGDRATVNFENMGKRLINLKHATLNVVDPREFQDKCPP
jgi:FKBP-type peptidyl-prolyl cis-trans isomerase 2